ncbi:MAG: HD domain-containing protein [Synergistetes bacterium]|nr:HD domain-containing protein [Synergistota bacterium]
MVESENDDLLRLVEETLPEISLISKEGWRKAVSEIWAEVFKKSKWKSIRDTQYNPLCPGVSLVDHTRAVTLAAIRIAECFEAIYGSEVKIDKDVLITASLLHDVCKVLEYEPKPGEEGAIKSKIGDIYQHGFLSGYYALEKGLPDEVVSIIVSHTGDSRALPKTLEGVVLLYVDMADADFHRLRFRAPLLLEKFKK